MEQTVSSVFDELEESRPLNYASTGQRLINFIIDWIVCFAITMALLFVFIFICEFNGHYVAYEFEQETTYSKFMNYFFAYIAMILMYTLAEGASKGRTLGKLITGTKAVKEDGSDITWKDALLRSLSRIVPFEPLSGFMAYPWHDKWTETRVIKTR